MAKAKSKSEDENAEVRLSSQSGRAPVHYSYEKFLADLGRRIRQLRKDRSWTLRDMVILHGFHVSQWQAFEGGKRGVAIPSLLRICEIFEIRLADLLGNAGELPSETPTAELTHKKR